MNWTQIKTEDDLNEISRLSETTAVLIFKHSTRCSISSMALSRLERKWDVSLNYPVFFLDLLSYRNLSARIEELFHVVHQSPQVLIIRHNQSVYDASHSQIQYEDILERIKQNEN